MFIKNRMRHVAMPVRSEVLDTLGRDESLARLADLAGG